MDAQYTNIFYSNDLQIIPNWDFRYKNR
jgi:hypothetical protein